MVKFIKGDVRMLEELQANLLNMISEDGHELAGSEADGYCLKIDTDVFGEMEMRLFETAINARINAGVFNPAQYQVQEELVQNSFALTADSAEKLDIIKNDILRGAKIPDENIAILQQPFAPGMYSTLVVVVLAFNLSEDQMKAVQLSAKTAKMGIKVTTYAKKASMIGTSTAQVFNRVSKEVALAGTEIGATVVAGTVKTGVEMVACAANIGIRDLNPKTLFQGENVQALSKTIKSLWGNKSDSKITNGFASL